MEKLCKICSVSDVSLFYDRKVNICMECYKIKNSKEYKCLICGEDRDENFEEERFSICRKCKSKKTLDNYHRKKSLKSLEIIPKEILDVSSKEILDTSSKEILDVSNSHTVDKKFIENVIIDFLRKNIFLFEGYTIKQKIDSLEKENQSLKEQIEELKSIQIKNSSQIKKNEDALYNIKRPEDLNDKVAKLKF
jgi:hypothetical protein